MALETVRSSSMIEMPEFWTRTAGDCPPVVGVLLQSGVLNAQQTTCLAKLDIDPNEMTEALTTSLERVKSHTLSRQQTALGDAVTKLMLEHSHVPAGDPNRWQIRMRADYLRTEATQRGLDSWRPDDVQETVETDQADIEELAAVES